MNTIREPSADALLERLEDISYSDYWLFGHQNAGHIGVSIKSNDGTESDVKNLTGKHPAVVGIDTLSFLGFEGLKDDLVKTVKQLNKEGVIITLSSHMPNFSMGGDGYYDYSPNVTEGDVGHRIMPGGDLNSKYIKFLNMIADFADECVDLDGNRIPMIFRPFHEDTGDWFWWGAAHLPDEDYIKLFRYTIDYLRIDRGIKSFLYAYSPNGYFESNKHYLKRYPGDDYIDLMGMDLYHDLPCDINKFFDRMIDSMEILQDCAMEHGKVYAVTEIGIRSLNSVPSGYYEGLAPSGNKYTNWFTEMIRRFSESEACMRMTYLLTWANFSDTQFWVPYETKDFRHEMCDDFLKFCNDPMVRLAP